MDINWNQHSTKAQKNAEAAQNDALTGLMGALDDLVADDALTTSQRTNLALQLTAALNSVRAGGQLSLGPASPAPVQQPTPTQVLTPPNSGNGNQSAEAARVAELERAIGTIARDTGAQVVLSNGQVVLDRTVDAINAAVDRKVTTATETATTAATTSSTQDVKDLVKELYDRTGEGTDDKTFHKGMFSDSNRVTDVTNYNRIVEISSKLKDKLVGS